LIARLYFENKIIYLRFANYTYDYIRLDFLAKQEIFKLINKEGESLLIK